jgi:hypothetical protein
MQNNSCIVCGSDKDLDTELIISVDGQKVTVKVCAEHADEITPKAAKAAYLKWKSDRDTQMQEFLAQAAKLGMKVVQQGDNLTVVQQSSGTVPAAILDSVAPGPTATVGPAVTLHGTREDGVLPTSEVDDVMQRRVAGLSGSVGNTGIERHTAYDPNELESKLPDGVREGFVKMELAEGRHGTPLALPAIRQDGLGTTRVRISKSMTDADLQRRFKQQASASVADDSGSTHSFKDGYDLHKCPICKGDGQIKKSQTEMIPCPKCGGSGLL